jgi:hypothetical protein
MYNLEQLKESIFRWILENFKSVVETPEFEEMDADLLRKLVADDSLNVAHEDQVFDAVIEWAKVEGKNRKRSFLRIAPLIRFSLCSRETLSVVVLEPLMANPVCMEHLQEGMTPLKLKSVQSPRSSYSTVVIGNSGGESWQQEKRVHGLLHNLLSLAHNAAEPM